jgi:lauroyl/myristoyl acyltransferase
MAKRAPTPSAPTPPRMPPSVENRATAQAAANDFSWKYWAFRLAGAIAPLVPLWLARPLAAAGGVVVWALARPLRKRAEWNLGHIPALAADPTKRRRAAREAFVALALNYLDFLRGRGVMREELARDWDIEGWELFERALARGKGVIALGAHYGPFEYAAWKMGELGHPVITPAERLKPEKLHHLVSFMRNHHGARMIAGDERETLRELIAALRRGEVIVFAVDRWVMGPSSPWPFFGEPARLPTAPFALAARSEAPVLLMAPRRIGLNHFGGVVELLTPERLDSTLTEEGDDQSGRDGDRDAAVARMRARVYPAIERLIAEEPGQWVSALSHVWDASTDSMASRGAAHS